MVKITITRALAELKLLKSKYEKSIIGSGLIAVQHGSKLKSPYSNVKPEDFILAAKSNFQSTSDLIKRMAEIKFKIDQSNSTTKVTIGGEEMTIQEALALKSILPFKEEEIRQYKVAYSQAVKAFDEATEENNLRISRIVSEAIGAGNGNPAEIEGSTIASISKLYKVELVDPCNLQSTIKELEDWVINFKSDVDYSLSESNSTTYIELEG